ncbi:MAG: flagellar biosynthesis protein FlhA [Janthinobacterium lividum]
MNQTFVRSDLVFALGLMGILVILILPLHKALLDFALAISLALSVLILMTSLFIQKALDFSSFPTVLLVSTMLRLALNVASTRLILTDGHEGPAAAGAVIKAFGNFIMGGNFVIGFIVFAILIIINFVVITKGAGRIAEVSARFTLDAMPGKQMAIDADLSSGLINEDEARTRRKNLEEEASFFGSMDGAAKFVRGDAVAGLCITFINVIGGMIIGVAQNDLSFAEASRTYTLLTVGDGLITQIPALIISTASALLVSKTSGDGTADKVMIGQLGAYPSALGLSSFLMLILSLLPNIPMLPFLALAAITGGMAWKLTQKQEKIATDIQVTQDLEAQPPPAEETVSNVLQIDQVRIELGYGLLPLANGQQGDSLAEKIKGLRLQLAREIGFVLPTVRIQDNLQLPPQSYIIRIKDTESARAEIRPNLLLAIDPENRNLQMAGEAVIEPTFGLNAIWIQPHLRSEAEAMNCTVVDPMTVITTHLSEIIRDNTPELLSFSETQKLLDGLDKPHQKLLTDMVPAQITLAGVQRVLQNLLSERVSIRDLATILEGVSESCSQTRNLTLITEHVRTRLARQLSNTYLNHENILPIVIIGPEWERILIDSLAGEQDNKYLALPPSKLQEFTSKIRDVYDEQLIQGEVPVLLTSSTIRSQVRSIIERFRPQTVVMSQNEVHPKIRIKTAGRI